MSGPEPEEDVENPASQQRWHAMTFLHWRYDAEDLQRLVPSKLEVDTCEGSGWLSITPFLMKDFRLGPLPAVPGIPTFAETNVRAYVRGPDRRDGLRFFSLEADSVPTVIGASSLYGVPYQFADMTVEEADVVRYRSRRRDKPDIGHDISVRPARSLADRAVAGALDPRRPPDQGAGGAPAVVVLGYGDRAPRSDAARRGRPPRPDGRTARPLLARSRRSRRRSFASLSFSGVSSFRGRIRTSWPCSFEAPETRDWLPDREWYVSDFPQFGLDAGREALRRFLAGEDDLTALHTKVALIATETIPGCDQASVSMLRAGTAVTPAYTSKTALLLDETQYKLGDGPCLSAIRHRGLEHVSTESDDRWPGFVAAARQHGVCATMSVPLGNGEAVVGALNLYSETDPVFDSGARDMACAFGDQLGVAVASATRYAEHFELAQQLQQAMESRAVIEQAKGILMAAQRCSADAAFNILVRASQNQNRKLRAIATEIVERYTTSDN